MPDFPKLRVFHPLALAAPIEHLVWRAIRVEMTTLKPDLAALAPRLCTDCLPCFIGTGLSPDYIAYTELAHPQRCPIFRRIQKHSLWYLFFFLLSIFYLRLFAVLVRLFLRFTAAISPCTCGSHSGIYRCFPDLEIIKTVNLHLIESFFYCFLSVFLWMMWRIFLCN